MQENNQEISNAVFSRDATIQPMQGKVDKNKLLRMVLMYVLSSRAHVNSNAIS